MKSPSNAKTAVVTGAGSGVGQAVALKLARAGWKVALIGRRQAALDETMNRTGEAAGKVLPIVCDIADPIAVQQMGRQVLEQFGPVEVLVNSAGTNAPRRSLEVLSLEDYQMIVNANLNGAYYCVQAFLPEMRRQQSGTIINIVSDAGRQANAKAGPAYVVSKFGQAGLTQAINVEERANGIRACSIFPGDINTPLLDRRPQPPPAEARQRMLQPEDLADCVWLVIHLPDRAVIEELVIRPR
jgi:NAD(P)-dependent dehydrogenase (short-subunit alcohol dehydrogenase family)